MRSPNSAFAIWTCRQRHIASGARSRTRAPRPLDRLAAYTTYDPSCRSPPCLPREREQARYRRVLCASGEPLLHAHAGPAVRLHPRGFGVSYTELSLALTAFGLVSAALQTPAGFFIDRTGARINLIGGLLLGSAAIAIAGLANSYWVFIAMFAVLGLANTIYHPADYALLSERVSPRRMTQVFSFHTCSGMIGSAIAPVTLLFLQDAVGWRGAFLCSSVLGVVAALFLALQGELSAVRTTHVKPRPEEVASASANGWRLLVSPPILLNLVFFIVLSMVGGGLNQYLVVGLGALYATPPGLANTALTGLLTMSAVG